MTDDEIKDKIREQLKRGIRISFRPPPIVPEQPGMGVLGMCSISFHRCAACDGDNPDFEFNPPESKVCLHNRCYRLWSKVEAQPWNVGS